jgi:hypothetical protein
MKNTARAVLSFAFASVLMAASGVVSASGLIDLATSSLGVTQPQAAGGMGALLSNAKSTMGGSQYSELLSMVPSLAGLADAAPSITNSGSSLGGLVSGAGSLLGGSSGSSMGSLGQLTEAFASLGLSPDMMGQFSNLLLNYVQKEGGEVAFDLLKGALPL